MRKFHAAALLAAALLSGLPCLAATPVSAAKTPEFHQAYAAFNSNDFAKAYDILTALVAQTPAYDAFGLLGQTEVSLGKYRDAAQHLTYAIQNTPAGKAADALPLLMGDLREARKHITTLHITVNQPDADVTLDGKALGKSPVDPEVYVDPGKHTIKATHPTLGSAESTLDAKMGQESAVTLELTQQPAVSAVDTSPPPLKYTPADLDKPSKPAAPINPPPTVETRRGIEDRTIVLIVGGAVTLLAAGTGTYLGLKSRAAKSDADSLAGQVEAKYGKYGCVNAGAGSSLCTSLAEKNNDKRDAARLANFSFALAGVAGVATVVTYALWPSPKAANSAFVLLPTVSPSAGGLSLQGDF